MDEILHDQAKLIFVVTACLVLFNLVMAVVCFLYTKEFIAHSTLVKAKITNIETKNGSTTAHLSFKDSTGQAVHTSVMIPQNKYTQDSEIELLVRNDNPAKIKLNTFITLWILPLAGLQGAVVVTVVIAIFVHMHIAKWPF